MNPVPIIATDFTSYRVLTIRAAELLPFVFAIHEIYFL